MRSMRPEHLNFPRSPSFVYVASHGARSGRRREGLPDHLAAHVAAMAAGHETWGVASRGPWAGSTMDKGDAQKVENDAAAFARTQ